MSSSALDELARMLKRGDRGAEIAQTWSNNLQPTFGTIVDVKDPEEMGRVKVILDEVNPELLTEQGFNQGDAQPTNTDWVEASVPMKGIQPEALVGKRVPISPRAGDPNRLKFGSPVFDPSETEKAEQPENSDQTRLPVYPSGSLPPADGANIGLMVVEQGGPMESDWLCVCLKRKGQMLWVRHIDLNHGHAGENDGELNATPETPSKDDKNDVKEKSVWDYVFPTTAKEMEKDSIYGTDPRKNPYGDQAKWYGGA
jgi:hypothetical protein